MNQFFDSIDESSTYNNSYDGSISTNSIKDVMDGNHVYPDVNARYSRLKIYDHINQAQN